MQREFIPVVEELEDLCQKYFETRLASSYLHGSIDKGDAVPGISDLDYFLIIFGTVSEKDRIWIRETVSLLQAKYKLVEEVHLAVYTIDEIKKNRFALFTLKYNASLRLGKNIMELLELRGCDIYYPDKVMAKSRLGFARKCFEDALKNLQPANTGGLPNNTYYAARKFARYFIVVEGAYFLMAQNRFQSFDKTDVLKGLEENTVGFKEILEATKIVLQDPINAGITKEEYLRLIKPFVEWMFRQIEEA